MDINGTTVLVAALSSGGAGLILREVIAGIGKLTRGMSAHETGRKTDLVSERDAAYARAERLADERDTEVRNRRRVEAWAARLERIIILAGLEGQMPSSPDLEDTITPAQLRQIRGGTA